MKIIASTMFFLALLSAAGPAWGAESMLLDPPRTDFRWYGVLFLGLSIASFNVAQNGYTESDEALKKADDAYDLYKAAATPEDADRYHKRTARYRRQAVGFESTANAAVFVGAVFLATGVYSFFADGGNAPILVSMDRVEFRYRF
jgi:hypothetical protein